MGRLVSRDLLVAGVRVGLVGAAEESGAGRAAASSHR